MAALVAGVHAAEGVSVTAPLQMPEEGPALGTVDEPLAAGEIVAIDRDAARVTVRHRGIARYYVDPSTRIFRVEDAILLTGLSAGDKIRFNVDRQDSKLVITRIENSN